jgi:hypothetical protein
MKYTDLQDTEKRKIVTTLESASARLGRDTYSNEPGHIDGHNPLGICKNCKNLGMMKTEFNNIYARCRSFDVVLTGKDRISTCTDFDRKGELTLDEMREIAYLIEAKKPKITGF